MSKGKRGGARPNTGPRAKFTILQEWVIGGTVDNHIRRRVLRRISRAQDEAFYGSKEGKLYRSWIEILHAVDDRYLPPPGASLATGMVLAKKYRSKNQKALERHRKKINLLLPRALSHYTPPPLPAKTPDGIRDLAIKAMVRLLRRSGHKVPFETVNDHLERYRHGVRDRMKAEPLV
jgi:hypothetical protein